ncbi:DUF3320 domain-containing protein [Mycetocola saprophilus]|uniref:DUF3320 domain-containing protein n=1 Tax=Mycetocola saprophilus TaxID=76636 RepID=UPI003BF0556B
MDTRAQSALALEVTAAALSPIVAARFAQILPQVPDWRSILIVKDRHEHGSETVASPTEAQFVLRAVTEDLADLGSPFAERLSPQAIAHARTLLNQANRMAEDRRIGAGTVSMVLDAAEAILHEIDASDARASIAALRAIESVPASPESPSVVRAEVPIQTPDVPASTDLRRGSFEVRATETLSYALAHGRVAAIDELTIHHVGSDLDAATLEVEAISPLGPLGEARILTINVAAGTPVILRDISVNLDPARMLAVDTTLRGSLRLTLRQADGTELIRHDHPVQVLAANQWSGAPLQLGLELIAAFVQPNAAEISTLAGEVSDRMRVETGSSALNGYQSESPERVDQMVRAAYLAMQDREIRYAEPPASWGLHGQKVRTPDEVLVGRLGTCLDLTVTLAAVLEEIGINSTLWFVPGHVFLGYWRVESSLDAPATTDAAEAINHVDLGRIALVETTSIPAGDPFEIARERPRIERLGTGSSVIDGVTDLQQARQAGIFPLPSRTLDETGGLVVREYRVSTGTAFEAPTAHVQGDHDHTERVLPPRVNQWKNAVLDLSLRNRLINYTEKSGHSLAVPQPMLAAFEDMINAGSGISLVPSDRLTEIDQARGVRHARDLPETQRTEMLTRRKQVFVDLREDTYSTRLRALAYKARTITEETGANNLYLALGMINWTLDDRTLRSPLILVPITLTGTARGQSFRIEIDEAGESTPNFCLLEKLRVTFGLDVSALASPIHDDSGIDLDAIFTASRQLFASAKLPFTVEATAELAVLQFAKYRLWKDIDENWEEFTANPLVKHLVHSPTEAFADPVGAAESTDLDELGTRMPVPADSSQLEAITEAEQGRTFVLEGPPGTGKSQTITNLLAHAISRGKRVLFVAEKRAALDVVKDRLDAVGLGAFSLDLHDKGARPTAVRAQISAAIETRVFADHAQLETSQETSRSSAGSLRRYAERLHEPGALGLSYYQARERVLATDARDEAVPISADFVSTADQSVLESLRQTLRALPETADLAVPRALHPWGFLTRPIDEPTTRALHEATSRFDAALLALRASDLDPAVITTCDTPVDVEEWVKLHQAPRFPIALVDSLAGIVATTRLGTLRERLLALESSAPAWTATVRPEILSTDIAGTHQRALAADASGFFGRKKRQRAALAELSGALLVEGKSVPPKQISALTGEIAATANALNEIVAEARTFAVPLPEAALNPFLAPGLTPLRDTLDWLSWLGRTLAPHSEHSATTAEMRRSYELPAASESARMALGEYAEAWRALDALLVPNDTASAPSPLVNWAGSHSLSEAWAETRPGRSLSEHGLVGIERWNGFLTQLEPVRAAGLSNAYTALRSGKIPADGAVLALDRGIAIASLDERAAAQGFVEFNATAHNRSVERFTQSAEEIRAELPRWLPEAVGKNRRIDPHFEGGAMGELRRQLERKRGGLSVRGLFDRYESLILQITPCILMSPESVARFFPARADLFDVVVFDEASQIRVADSIGAMGRARSVVIVGDSRQMPPTSFAEAQSTDSEEELEESGVVRDEESILTECVQARVPRKWLSWHYRSQDESLISFSNHAYYEGKLSSFPAPFGAAEPDSSHGISLVRVNGHFERSGPTRTLRTNRVEAQAIVNEVARRFAAHPDSTPSLGIVTFNAQQRLLVETMLREHTDERLAAALDERDGLFVKNLENVQGDERDTILFSIAFSKNERGVLPLNFGPLTRAGGERRFNVAITRAKRQVMVFASFDPSELRAEETTSVGIKHLRTYLELAANGVESAGDVASAPRRADRHRDDIAHALRSRGLVVRTDVGLSDFRVDLSIARPENPDQPLVAVLLDGVDWRQRRTVADRDGLPGEVLRNLMRWPGVERVWLPEWLQQREATIERLNTAVLNAEAARLVPEPQTSTPTVGSTSDTMPTGSAAIDFEIGTDSAWESDGGSKLPDPPASKESSPRQQSVAPPRVDGDVERPTWRAVPAFPAVDDEFVPLVRGPVVTEPIVDSAVVSHAMDENATGEKTDSGPATFVPWMVPTAGDPRVLDDLPRVAAVAAVRAQIHAMLEAEGPVHHQRLVRRIGEAFGLSRVTAGRAETILQAVPAELARTENGTFIWPQGVIPNEYQLIRQASGDDRRSPEQIPLEEIANAMRRVAELSGGMDDDTILREGLSIFGWLRLTSGIQERMNAALALASERGLVSRRGDIWVASPRS